MEDKIRYPEVDAYIRSTVERETGHLKEMEAYAQINHIPIVSPETAVFLKVLINLRKPGRILEAGTAIGYSACVMASSMPEDGLIDTMEIEDEMVEIAHKNIKLLGLEKRIRIISGDALEIMQCLTTPYDMIFLDASKGQYNEYLNESLRLLEPGGLLVSDNVLYKGLVTQNEPVSHKHRTISVRLREYLNSICNDKRLQTAIIPIGDGMAVSIRKGD